MSLLAAAEYMELIQRQTKLKPEHFKSISHPQPGLATHSDDTAVLYISMKCFIVWRMNWMSCNRVMKLRLLSLVATV